MYHEIIDMIADSPIVFRITMGIFMLLFIILCYWVQGPTYGYL